jgi:hypothetical protein
MVRRDAGDRLPEDRSSIPKVPGRIMATFSRTRKNGQVGNLRCIRAFEIARLKFCDPPPGPDF